MAMRPVIGLGLVAGAAAVAWFATRPRNASGSVLPSIPAAATGARSIDDLINLMPSPMPANWAAVLNAVTGGNAAGMTAGDYQLLRSQLYLAREVMTREGYSLSRPGDYDTDLGRIMLVNTASGLTARI